MNEKRSYTEYLVVVTPQTHFAIGFADYQAEKDMLKVTVDNKDITEEGYTVTRNVGNVLEFNPAVPVDSVVRIQRVTDIDAPFYIFTAGNSFVPSNVDQNFKQLLHAQQEVRDGFDKLESDVIPLVVGLPEALKQAQDAAAQAQEAKEAAQEAAQTSRSASNVIDASGLNQQQINDKSISTVDSIADLIVFPNPKNGQVVQVQSYYKVTNFALKDPFKGGGDFQFVSTRASENDGISVFKGWVRLSDWNEVNLFQAGGKTTDDDASFDNHPVIDRAITFARSIRSKVVVGGAFRTSKPVVLQSQDCFEGVDWLTSRVFKTTNDTLPLGSRIAPERDGIIADNYEVDACLIFLAPNNGYASRIRVSNIFFQAGQWNDGKPATYGLYAPRHDSIVGENLQFDNVLFGFRAMNMYQNRYVNFRSIGSRVGNVNNGAMGMTVYDGEGIMTGTTNTFERFIFVNYKNGYDIQNLQTSSFDRCYGEGIADNNGANESIVFKFTNPYQLTLSNCGQEQTNAAALFIRDDGINPITKTIKIDGYQAYWGVSGFTTDIGQQLITLSGNVIATFDNSVLKKTGTGIIGDFAYITGGASLIRLGLSIGSVVGDLSKYINLSKAMVEGDGGMVKSSVPIGNDLNNGIEWKAGVVHKVINGATLNLPSGLSDAYGTSSWYGLNATQGVQILTLTNSPTTLWKRTVTGVGNLGIWAAV